MSTRWTRATPLCEVLVRVEAENSRDIVAFEVPAPGSNVGDHLLDDVIAPITLNKVPA